MNNKVKTKTGKITLEGYYKSLLEQAVSFREQVMKECHCSKNTFYKWMRGDSTPRPLEREKLAEITGIPADVLFPNTKSNV